MELVTAKDKIKATLIDHDLIRPECIDECVDKVIEWYKQHQRYMKMKDLNMILEPYKK